MMKDKKFIFTSGLLSVFLLMIVLTYVYFSLTISGNVYQNIIFGITTNCYIAIYDIECLYQGYCFVYYFICNHASINTYYVVGLFFVKTYFEVFYFQRYFVSIKSFSVIWYCNWVYLYLVFSKIIYYLFFFLEKGSFYFDVLLNLKLQELFHSICF